MTDTTAPAEGAETAPSEAPAETDWKAEAEKWKANSRKNEDNAKANASAAKELAELKQAQLTEAEKEKQRADAAEKERDALRVEALRSSVALDKKLTPTQAKRLVGTTREELEADADELLADLKAGTATTPTAAGQGNTGTAIGEGKEPTLNELIRASRK